MEGRHSGRVGLSGWFVLQPDRRWGAGLHGLLAGLSHLLGPVFSLVLRPPPPPRLHPRSFLTHEHLGEHAPGPRLREDGSPGGSALLSRPLESALDGTCVNSSTAGSAASARLHHFSSVLFCNLFPRESCGLGSLSPVWACLAKRVTGASHRQTA